MLYIRMVTGNPSYETLQRELDSLPNDKLLIVAIGNEPGVGSQGQTPQEYASYFFKYRNLLKEINPQILVATAGFIPRYGFHHCSSGNRCGGQQYFEEAMAEYRRLSGHNMVEDIDVFNIHSYNTLWIDYVPWLIEDVKGWRAFMKSIGGQNKPLIVTEWGTLDYLVPREKSILFMLAGFEFFLEARSRETGYPADNYRLVQIALWFPINDGEGYPFENFWENGNLFDSDSGEITLSGTALKEFVENHEPLKEYHDLFLPQIYKSFGE